MWKWGFWWSRQESNLHLRLRKPTYYPLYYETINEVAKIVAFSRFAYNQ